MTMEGENGISSEAQATRDAVEDRLSTENTLGMITEQSNHCTDMIKALKADLDENRLTTKDGMSFLEVKNHLLLQYLISLAGITKLKTSGKSIQGSAYLNQLIEARVFLEKMRPIESKLKYQIDKLVSASSQGKDSSDPLKYRANLDDLQNDDGASSEDEDSDEEKVTGESSGKSGIYRPPRVAPQHFEDEDEATPAKKAEKSRKKSINQSLIRELQEEYLDTPVEIHNMGDAYAKQLSREVRDKQRFEETYMTRLPVTKRDKHRENAMSTIGVLGDEITDFKKRQNTPGKSGKGKKRKLSSKSKGSGKKFRK